MTTLSLLKELDIKVVPSYSLNTLHKVLDLYKKKLNGGKLDVPSGADDKPKVMPMENISEKGDDSSFCKIPKRDLRIKKGDVFMAFGINGKRRPFVVAQVVTNGVYAIPLTTKQDAYTLIPHHSRFLSTGYFANYFIFVKKEVVGSGFYTILDDTRTLNKAIKLIKEKLTNDLL